MLAATFKPSPSVGIETSRPVPLLKLVWTSSVERLLAATDETRLDLVWNYTASVAYLLGRRVHRKHTNLDIGSEAILWLLKPVWNG